MELLLDPNAWISLATLTALEIVLGVDNIIFISILVGRLPAEQRAKARTIGLGLAMGSRVLLLFSLAFIMKLTTPLFAVADHDVSGRDLILIAGGLFLLWKAVHEIHNSLEGQAATHEDQVPASYASVITQIAIIDVVFSLDSVITAIGLADEIAVMIAAVMIAIGVMMLAARAISEFVDAHPTIKMLALSFLILVGVTLFADGLGFHIPKGYIYFSMAFSIGVETLNLRARAVAKKRAAAAVDPIQLRKRYGE